MAKSIKCLDVGVPCDSEARADTVEELMEKVADHARNEHGMTEIPPEILQKVKQAIRDVN
jgi:predicted small metal-binding protein